MRNPNGYGSIKKLGGKRRRPFAVYITTGWERIDEERTRQIQKPIGYYETRQDAMIALAEYNKNPYDIDKRNITFSQIYEILLETKFSKMKPSARRSYTMPYKNCQRLYNMRMKEIKADHMQRVLDDHSHLSEATLHTYKKLFNAIFTFAIKNDICEKNYATLLEINSTYVPPEKEQTISREKIKLFWENLDWTNETKSTNQASKLYLMDFVLVHVHTGMRPAEMFNLKKEDVHLEERYITCRGTKTENADRIIPIHRDIEPLIEKRLKADIDSVYLFPNTKGTALAHTTYDYWFKPMCECFGLNITPHKCRKAFTSYATASGMNPIIVRKITGHSGGNITEDIYTHLQTEDLVAEIDKFRI